MNQRHEKEECLSNDERISNIYDGEYFRVLHRKGDILIVQCNTCGPDAPQLRASRRSNGNILKHIQRRHSDLLAKIRAEKNIKCRATGIRRVSKKVDASNKDSEVEMKNERLDTSLLTDDPKGRMVFIESSTSDTLVNYQYLDRNECSESEHIQLLQTDDHLTSEEQEAADFLTQDNLNDDNHEHKSDTLECEYEESPDTVSSDDDKTKKNLNKEVIELKKELMQKEFDYIQELRREKHVFEIEILRQEMEFKKVEYRKRIEILDKQLRENNNKT